MEGTHRRTLGDMPPKSVPTKLGTPGGSSGKTMDCGPNRTPHGTPRPTLVPHQGSRSTKGGWQRYCWIPTDLERLFGSLRMVKVEAFAKVARCWVNANFARCSSRAAAH